MKMKRGMVKRVLSCFLAMALTAGAISGCGKQSGDKESLVDKAAKNSKDYVFAMELLDIDKDSDFSRIQYAGDKVYASTYGGDGYINIFSFNSDGSDIRNTKLNTSDNENYSYISYDKDGNIYGIYYVYHWSYEDEDMHIYENENGEMIEAEDKDSTDKEAETKGEDVKEEEVKEENLEGTETLATADELEASEAEETVDSTDAENEGMMDESENDEVYLVKFDANGNLQYKLDLLKEFPNEDNYISANGLVITDDGKLILSIDQGIFRYDEETGFKTLVDLKDNNDYRYYQLYKGFGNKLYVQSYGEKGIELCSFDPETGKIGDPSSVVTGYTDASFFGGNGYDLYMCKNDGIYGIDFAKEESTKLLDFVDSDIEMTSSTNLFTAISDAEFVALLPDAEYKMYVARLTKIPADQVKEKKILTMGGYYIDYDVRRQAFEFNKNNTEYKIKFVDYSSYDDNGEYGAGVEKMNMDIISGNTPDIMVLSSQMPVDSYINKGLFADISTYINNDPDIGNVELVTNVMDALRTGDKLYQLVPGFYVGSMAVKKSLTGGKNVFSFKDCKDLMEKYGVSTDAAFGIMPRNSFLEQGIRYSGNSYIDWENKSCSFDSESFIEFLEFAGKFPEEYPDSAWEDYKDTLYLENEALFAIINLNGFRSYSYMRDIQFGEDVAFVGYPNEFGINNSVIMPYERLAISSQSKYKDAAWEFLKSFLSEEYQNTLDYCFPVRKSSFEKQAQESTQKLYYMDGDKKVEYEDTYYVGGQEVTAKPLSNEDVVELTNYIKSLTLVSNYNESVNNIIFEEASAFFSGQKSAKEVADIIQSRLTIYVNENS